MTKTLNETIRRFEMKQMIVSGLGLLAAVGISIVVNTVHLNSVAEQATKFISRLVQVEDFREIGLTLEDTRLDGFSRIDFRSERPGRNFSIPEAQNIDVSFWHYLTTERVALPTTDQLGSDHRDTITFEFSRFRLIPYAILAWLALIIFSVPQTRYMKQRLVEQYEKDISANRAEAKADIARQVRHNLRTPLAALMRIPARLPESVKSDRELLASSIAHIRSIVSALDDGESSKKLAEATSSELYDSLLQSVREISLIVPKNIQFSNEIDDSVVSALIPHIPHEFRALLGNIVNNSIDAIAGSHGRITITARDMGPEIEIDIEDNGRGITSENLDRIFEKGFSSGKPDGSGIGLHHAKTWVEAWGGSIVATSTPGKSTTIQIHLPIDERAAWYVPRLKFSRQDKLIILDDHLSAHGLWEMRLTEAGILSQAQFAQTPAEVEKIIQTSSTPSHVHYLFDYDIQSQISGLDILDRLPKDSHRYLVTGHFDQPSIRDRCGKSGVQLLPKGELCRIPIVVT